MACTWAGVGEDGMRGSMRQRRGAWELRVYQGRDPVTGRDRYTTRTVRGSRREAERALAAMVAASPDGGVAPTTAALATETASSRTSGC